MLTTFSVLIYLGLTAAIPSNYQVQQSNPSITLSGSYWDASLRYQSGRPGWTIEDLNTTFHSSQLSHVEVGECHYSFVPGNGQPSRTDTCAGELKGTKLKYSWGYTDADHYSLNITQNIQIQNEHLIIYGNGFLYSYKCGGLTGMQSDCSGMGKVDIEHYCKVDGNVTACYAPDGTEWTSVE